MRIRERGAVGGWVKELLLDGCWLISTDLVVAGSTYYS
jgi:hypothetical protein